VIDDLHIIDGHVHTYVHNWLDKLVGDIRYTGAKQFCCLVTARDSTGQWENALELKRRMPNDVFLLGGFDFQSGEPYEEQLQHLIDVGCDGLKLLTGKPDRRKALGHALDSPVFTPFLKLAEETRFPVLWHVGDPPEFWSKETVPLWARQRGWWYDETHPPKAQLDAEIANAFARHPNLNLILPHFFFLSDRLEDAAALLKKYPSYNIDLAPGVEMFHNLTARHADARQFFIDHADRIIFGTDFGMSCGWGRDRGMMIRRFLETADHFDVPEDPAMTPDARPPLHGLNLPREVLKKIYADNFRRVVGTSPRPLRTQHVEV
jgi:predicted TIM-barrel fold metal-dependent hydrolase